MDPRRHSPSVRRVAAPEVARLLRLDRERYRGFNVRHVHQIARREHGVTVSYRFLKDTLQAAGVVKKYRGRGRHRRRREPRACLGELLPMDGRPHAWLARRPTERPVLIAVLEDATKRVWSAQLWAGETTVALLTAVRDVITTYGRPLARSTDRAPWAFHPPQAKGPVNRRQLTQVGRAWARLGIEHIPASSPQARGRRERLNRPFPDRLVNERRVATVTTLTPPMPICASASFRITTRRSAARPPIPRAPLSPSGVWTSSRSSVTRRIASWPVPTRWPSTAGRSRSRVSQDAGRAPACR
jgi:hypothetical protein